MKDYDVYADQAGAGWFNELPHPITAESPRKALEIFEQVHLQPATSMAAVVYRGAEPNGNFAVRLVEKTYPLMAVDPTTAKTIKKLVRRLHLSFRKSA